MRYLNISLQPKYIENLFLMIDIFVFSYWHKFIHCKEIKRFEFNLTRLVLIMKYVDDVQKTLAHPLLSESV